MDAILAKYKKAAPSGTRLGAHQKSKTVWNGRLRGQIWCYAKNLNQNIP